MRRWEVCTGLCCGHDDGAVHPAVARVELSSCAPFGVDLDVLDPEEFGSVCCREPSGLATQRLLEMIERVEDIIGASLTEHAPRDDADLARDADVVRRIGSALCR
jgi:arginase family enzyme